MTSLKDDNELWQKFIKDVKPLKRNKEIVALNLPHKIPLFPKRDFLNTVSVTASENFSGSALNLPLNCLFPTLRNSQKKGKVSIDATLDLHGETLQNAYIILVRFIEKALWLNNRVILVITGKSLGKISHDRPRLVEMVPLWFQKPPLSQYIKRITYARKEHGDNGAFYVFLKSFEDIDN